jgi:hypothetical protein
MKTSGLFALAAGLGAWFAWKRGRRAESTTQPRALSQWENEGGHVEGTQDNRAAHAGGSTPTKWEFPRH